MSKQIAISKFMEKLGFPLKNINWSYGAFNEAGDKLLLRQNSYNFDFRSKEVKLMGNDWNACSNGRTERIQHLRELAENMGTVKCYVMSIIGNHKLGKSGENSFEITGYKDDRVFPITELRFTAEGEVFGVFGAPVLVSEI